MNEKFLKPYNPSETEDTLYKRCEESGFFNPDNLPSERSEPFSIIMPPPNANGSLHVGHALFITLEDLIIRYKRMRGYRTLWVPGADHAGFETQIVYEKKLEKEGRSRFKMDPQELYNEILAFTLENKSIMENQVRKLGASCDWSRERFTLEPEIVQEVQKTFKKMFDDGLVYRRKRPVNWCIKHQTSLSDVETISIERNDPLYYMTYGPFTLATVRPETKFGDTAIAVNPNDERYKDYVGKEIEIDTLIGTAKLTVIADEFVDPSFGTGVVKVTPAHDPHDFEMGLRHNLEAVEVIDQYGKLNERCGKYAGLKIAEARAVISEDLKKAGLLEKVDENYTHAVKTCFKCNTVIEPRLMDQWFVKMKPLAEKALEAVEQKKVDFIPDNYRKIFNHWMNTTLDWNISRQIVWGIKIPAKICDACEEGYADLNNSITTCKKCGKPVREDTDTFDTWFSSGQWPLLSLSYPEGKDMKTYYPTDVMETGYDLIFKWIPRMIIFGLYLVHDVPFKTVYLHGLVNDAHGKKMSKSKGNVINPLDVTEKYGTDALRMALIVGNTPGTDLALSEGKIKGYKYFANKVWNIARFVLTATEDLDKKSTPSYTKEDTILIEEFEKLLTDVTDDLDAYRIHLASEKVYHYIWHTFADVIIEESKSLLASSDEEVKTSRKYLLHHLFVESLKLLHPFMPFVTEEVWQALPERESDLLMVAPWPKH